MGTAGLSADLPSIQKACKMLSVLMLHSGSVMCSVMLQYTGRPLFVQLSEGTLALKTCSGLVPFTPPS